jgi:hypothetical protein
MIILIGADNDRSGVGQMKAKEAADSVGGLVVVPTDEGCDWNDVAVKHGAGAVRNAIETALRLPSQVLDDLHRFFGRFVSYPSEHAHVAHTLWAVHTHLMDAWNRRRDWLLFRLSPDLVRLACLRSLNQLCLDQSKR